MTMPPQPREESMPGPWEWADGVGPDLTVSLLLDALLAEKRAHQKLRAEMQEMRDWYIARSQRMQSIYSETFDSRFADRAEYDENVADQLTEILEENK